MDFKIPTKEQIDKEYVRLNTIVTNLKKTKKFNEFLKSYNYSNEMTDKREQQTYDFIQKLSTPDIITYFNKIKNKPNIKHLIYLVFVHNGILIYDNVIKKYMIGNIIQN